MRESIGSTFLYNIIIVFILVVFAFIGSALTYYKAFKVNSVIIDSVEKFEGVNNYSKDEISSRLSTLGYTMRDGYNCRERNGTNPESLNDQYHKYCVYIKENENKYIVYEVVTYITFDLPLIGESFSIPVVARTKGIYFH